MIESRFVFDFLKVGDWGIRHYYHFGRLRTHGDMNIYESENPFDWRLVRKAAHSYAALHGFRVETKFYPKTNEFIVARVCPPASVLRAVSLTRSAALDRYEREARLKKWRKRQKRLKAFTNALAQVEPLTHHRKKLCPTI